MLQVIPAVVTGDWALGETVDDGETGWHVEAALDEAPNEKGERRRRGVAAESKAREADDGWLLYWHDRVGSFDRNHRAIAKSNCANRNSFSVSCLLASLVRFFQPAQNCLWLCCSSLGEPAPHLRSPFPARPFGLRFAQAMSFHSILLTACQTKFLTRPIHAQAFGKRSILEHCGERFESEIEQLNVECISLQGLLERNHVEDLGVIHNDAEEFGCAIQSEPNRDRYSPKAILFETKHMLGKEFSAIKHRLEQTGSLVRTAESDALAVAGSKGLDTHGWSRRERFG